MSEHRMKINRNVRGFRLAPSMVNKDHFKARFRNLLYGQSITLGPAIYEELEKESQERSEAAYRHGYDDGKAIGIQEGREEIKDVMANLTTMLETLADKREILLRDAESMIVQLAISVAKTILHREVQTDRDIIKAVAKESLKLVEDKKRVSIKIHPSDWHTMKEYEGEILSSVQGVKEFEIKEDDRVNPGGCVVETDSGIIDAQLETQLSEFTDSLLEAV